MPHSLTGIPLKSGISQTQTLNVRLPHNSRLYVGFETLKDLEPEEKAMYQNVIRGTFGQYFADVYFDTTESTLTNNEWFQRISYQNPSDYLLVIRLASSESGNLVRPKHCHFFNKDDKADSVDSKAQYQPATRPNQQQTRPKLISEAHPFGPDLAGGGVTLDQEAQELDAVIEQLMNAEASTGQSTASADSPKVTNTPVVPLNPENKKAEIAVQQVTSPLDPDMISADEIDFDEPQDPAYTAAILADPGLPMQEKGPECEIHFGRGRDAVAVSTWLYARHRQALIDRRQFKGEAGILGWQLETLPDLFEASMHRLAKQYAGRGPNSY